MSKQPGEITTKPEPKTKKKLNRLSAEECKGLRAHLGSNGQVLSRRFQQLSELMHLKGYL